VLYTSSQCLLVLCSFCLIHIPRMFSLYLIKHCVIWLGRLLSAMTRFICIVYI
ncbi:predicted protein, partial [Nematostella vectensis]